jgi:Putative stress-responsive transcriptional regulator
MQDKLTRSRSDRILGGVCSGLARYFNIDTTIVRLIFVIAVLMGGVSPLLYLVLWIVMPEEPLSFPSSPMPSQIPLNQQDPTGEWQYDPYTGEQIKR